MALVMIYCIGLMILWMEMIKDKEESGWHGRVDGDYGRNQGEMKCIENDLGIIFVFWIWIVVEHVY